MTINKEKVTANGSKVSGVMTRMGHYTFAELQRFTKLGNTDLCLALIQLLQEGKIEQNRDEMGVYYVLC